PLAHRWLDRLTLAILVFSVSLTLGAAAPAFLAAVGAPRSSAAPEGSSRPLALPHRPPEILSQPPSEGPGAPFDPGDPPRGQLGLTRGPLTLREQPTLGSEVVGEVKAGELVTVPFITGEWALVYYTGPGGLLMGWAKKSEIAIR